MLPIENNTILTSMYQEWFLDYASYVILERALPNIADGLKPVQRRILHTMKTLDDGRYNKVANIIGATMSYHPHGDQSIGNTLVNLGQKCLLIDTQGNWGNLLTGDSAAAPRYIEARLSSLALDTVYSPQITEWTRSYDGRKDEPVTLPVKFPLLLAQGASGIAVGLASKILPHNFNEILDAAIECLHNRPFSLYPDFPTGGVIDVSKYHDGAAGGKVKIRAKIEKADARTLVITQIPYSKTTQAVIASINDAAGKGKINIRKIDDNTAREVKIILHLGMGDSPDKTIEALYAFTDCEVSVCVNSCVIKDNRPQFLTITELLRNSVTRTTDILKRELQDELYKTKDALYFTTLEKIFIGHKFYDDPTVRNTTDMESAIIRLSQLFDPFKDSLNRIISNSDLMHLWEIKIGRILKFNIVKTDERIARLEEHIAQIQFDIDNIIDTTERWYIYLKDKYGKGYPRMTEIRSFSPVEVAKVAIANRILYHDSANGFVGTSLSGCKPLFECSDHDDILVVYSDGKYKIIRVDNKIYIGKSVIHISLYKRRDERTVYNVIYRHGKEGSYYMKRFSINGIVRGKVYDMTKALPGSRIEWLTRNSNGEAETVKVTLSDERTATGRKPRNTELFVDFADLQIKGKDSLGNLVTKFKVKRITLFKSGVSTLKGLEVWFDSNSLRLNYEGRGDSLGIFQGEDKILVITTQGDYFTTTYSDLNQFENNIYRIEKFLPDKVWTLVLYDNAHRATYLKRFMLEKTDKPLNFVGGESGGDILLLTDINNPMITLTTIASSYAEGVKINIEANRFIGVKSIKAKGKRITTEKIIETSATSLNEENFETTVTDTTQNPANESTAIMNNNRNNQPSLFDFIQSDEL